VVDEKVTPKMQEYWHACYCWGQLAATIAPKSFGMLCDVHSDVLPLLGNEVTINSAISAMLSAVRFVEMEDCPPCPQELYKTDKFKTMVPGPYESYIHATASLSKRTTLMVLLPVPGLFDKMGVSLYIEKSANAHSNENVCDRFRCEAEMLGMRPPKHVVRMTGVSWFWRHLRKCCGVDRFFAFEGPCAKAIVAYQQQGVKLIGGQFGYILQSVTDTKSSICVVTNERWIIEYNLDRFSADVLSAGEISSYIKEIRPVTKTLQCPSKRRLLCSRRKHASLLLVPGLQPREGRCTP